MSNPTNKANNDSDEKNWSWRDFGESILKFALFIVFRTMQNLASMDICFTFCQEGTAKLIMRGKSFHRCIMSFAGYHLNDPEKPGYQQYEKGKGSPRIPDWEVVYHGIGNKIGFKEEGDAYYDDRPWILKKAGVYWVGWPWLHSVYEYPFEWNELSMDIETGEEKIFPRKALTRFIYVADFTYAVRTVGAETKDRLPTDLITLVTIAIRNPYRALLLVEDWMQRLTAAINPHVRTFVGSKDYQEIIVPVKKKLQDEKEGGEEKDDSEENNEKRNEKIEKEWWENFSKPIVDLNKKLLGEKYTDKTDKSGVSEKPSGLEGRYGIKVRTAELKDVDLSGESKGENLKNTIKEYAAKQDAIVKTTIANAEGKAKIIIGNADATALESRLQVIDRYGSTGELLIQLDTMKDSAGKDGNTIIWANNPLIPVTEKLRPEKKKEVDNDARDNTHLK